MYNSNLKNVDELDVSIIKELQKNSRITVKDLAKSLDRRRATIHARMQKLENNNIITNYSIGLNYEELGLGITAFVLLSVTDKAFTNINDPMKLGKQISEMGGVLQKCTV